MTHTTPRPLTHDLRLHAALVLVVCAIVYWPMLGRSGFSSTEGHRVIPGWELLHTLRDDPAGSRLDDLLVPRMFGQPYLRKPPGMPWAVAASAAVFGETEWSARAVSAAAATGAALLSLLFATRWFGRPWGLAAGLVHALTPWFWSAGRSAEIESLNNLATHAAALLVLDILVGPAPRSRARAVIRVLLAAAAIIVAGLAKGPASAPVLVAAIAAPLIVKRSWRPLVNPGLLLSLATAGLILGAIGFATWQALHRAGAPAITQGVGDFLWDSRKVLGILSLPFAAFAAGMPGSLALLFAWSPAGRDVLTAKQRAAEPAQPGPSTIARCLALTCLLSLLILTAAGVSNPRYAMPAMTLPALLAAHAAAVAGCGLDAKGTRLWRLLTLSRWWLVPAILLVAAAVYVPISESRRDRSSGREAGRVIAPLVPDGAEVWADHMIEARPEVLLYAQRRAAELSRRLTPRWKPASSAEPCPMPPAGNCLLLRSDTGSGEAQRYEAAGWSPRTHELVGGRVHKFTYVLDLVIE